jgi:Uri superfamily endonuclease
MRRWCEARGKLNTEDDLDLPDRPGTYVLWVQLAERLTVQVGKLGTITLPDGIYAYVGSARGPGGLRARLQRHLRPDKPIHWHIDAVTVLVPVMVIWFEPSPERLECGWARTLAALPDVAIPLPGFGSSDCRCRSHFFAVPAGSMRQAWEALGRPAARPSAPRD